jgi:chaperonin GroES
MAYTKFRPRGNYVLLSRANDEVKVGHIIIPDSAQKRADRGVVVAVGPGTLLPSGERIPMELQLGDIVLFPGQLGAEITIDGEKFTLLTEDAVSGVVEP